MTAVLRPPSEALKKQLFMTKWELKALANNLTSRVFPMGPWYGPLAPSKGSELWAPILQVVCNGVLLWITGIPRRDENALADF